MSFRGINTTVIQIRRQVFTEVARMAYANVKGCLLYTSRCV